MCQDRIGQVHVEVTAGLTVAFPGCWLVEPRDSYILASITRA